MKESTKMGRSTATVKNKLFIDFNICLMLFQQVSTSGMMGGNMKDSSNKVKSMAKVRKTIIIKIIASNIV